MCLATSYNAGPFGPHFVVCWNARDRRPFTSNCYRGGATDGRSSDL